MSCIPMHVKQLKLNQLYSQAATKICSRQSLAEMLNPEKIRHSREEPVHLPEDTTTDLYSTDDYDSHSFLRKLMQTLWIIVSLPASVLKCCYMTKRWISPVPVMQGRCEVLSTDAETGIMWIFMYLITYSSCCVVLGNYTFLCALIPFTLLIALFILHCLQECLYEFHKWTFCLITFQ